jgi:hypothetical protein
MSEPDSGTNFESLGREANSPLPEPHHGVDNVRLAPSAATCAGHRQVRFSMASSSLRL